MIVITEHELGELRRKASEPDARLADMIEANKEAERYAGRLEAVLEHIRTVCRLAHVGDNVEYDSVLDVIAALARVKDDRTTIGKYAPKQG